MPLNAAIGQVFTPYRPGGRNGNQFWRTKLSCVVVKSLFEASVEKAQNGPSTQLIKARSCVERSNPTIKAKEHS
jgi:hypothetical protein